MNLLELQQTLPREAPGSIKVPPSAFVTSWELAPRESILLGLQLIGPTQQREIIRLAREHIKAGDGEALDAVESFELAVMRYFVWFGICDPNNTTKNPQLFQTSQSVFDGLTESGARFVFDAIQKLEIETSPRSIEASEDEIIDVVSAIGDGRLGELDPRQQSAALRYLKELHTLLS